MTFLMDIGNQVDIDLLTQINMRDFNLVVLQGDAPIAIHDPCFV